MTTATPAELAHWLSERFKEPPEEFEGGREEMLEALAEHFRVSLDEAAHWLDELEHLGHLRYAAEARSIGGSPGSWIIYPSPRDNPEL
jgi:hypothetical protein